MSLVEEKYNQTLDSMSGVEKVERALSLFESICEMLTLQLQREYPGLRGRELRRRVAARLYMAEPAVLSLVQRARGD